MESSPRPFLALLLVPALATSLAAQLVNGGAETGALAPWVPDLSGAPSGNTAIIKAVTTQLQTAPPVLPAVGNWFFSFATQPAGAAGSFVRMSQVVPLVAPPAELALTGRVQTEFGDHGDARLELLNAASAVLATSTLGGLVSDGAWTGFYLDEGVPSGTTQCRVTLTGTVQAGTAVNVFWDNLQLGASPWAIVGPGLAGTAGVPGIDGDGGLAAGAPVTIALDDARPGSSAFLVIGVAALVAPLKGGLLVPQPDFLLLLPTSPAGTSGLTAPWPPGLPSGSKVWFQWWIQDPVGPQGFAASPGLVGTTP